MIVVTATQSPAPTPSAAPDAAPAEQGGDFLAMLQNHLPAAVPQLSADSKPLPEKDEQAEGTLPLEQLLQQWGLALAQPVLPGNATVKQAPRATAEEGTDGKAGKLDGLSANLAADPAKTASLAAEEGVSPLEGGKKRKGGEFAEVIDSLRQPTEKPELPHKAVSTPAVTQPQNPESARPATLHIPVPVGDERWREALSQRAVFMASQNMQSAELQLNPPHLGPLEVRLTIQNQEATLNFVSPHAAVREAIQSASPRLIEMFAGSGLSLGNVNVGADSQQQAAWAQSMTQQGQSQERGERRGWQQGEAMAGMSGVSGHAGSGSQVWVRHGKLGGVDTFA
ncbi:flagellar hook-length control protein FliK [Leeia sp.]|uniref:flagellar hook-length control protein FliK n=1 Tax=Leeia sp. TaxID=2884678 RepID=UPI0035B260F3